MWILVGDRAHPLEQILKTSDACFYSTPLEIKVLVPDKDWPIGHTCSWLWIWYSDCKETRTGNTFWRLGLGEAETLSVGTTGPAIRPVTQGCPCGTIVPEFPASLLFSVPAYYLILVLLHFHQSWNTTSSQSPLLPHVNRNSFRNPFCCLNPTLQLFTMCSLEKWS